MGSYLEDKVSLVKSFKKHCDDMWDEYQKISRHASDARLIKAMMAETAFKLIGGGLPGIRGDQERRAIYVVKDELKKQFELIDAPALAMYQKRVEKAFVEFSEEFTQLCIKHQVYETLETELNQLLVLKV